jgi:hypothetical protein
MEQTLPARLPLRPRHDHASTGEEREEMSKHKEVLERDLSLYQARCTERIKWSDDAKRDGDLTRASVFTGEANEAHERADAIRHALAVMAKADTLEKQVEFLEWIVWMEREFGFTHVNRSGIVSVKKADGWPVISWPGQLRDGWKHWDEIKEAVK